MLIDIYCNDSSALNPDEVSRAEDLIKERNRKNEKKRTRYHAQCAAAKGEALCAAAKGLVEQWTCDVCKSCSYQLSCLLGPQEIHLPFKGQSIGHGRRGHLEGARGSWVD